MYVAFEGVDGVGKSTQIELLKESFLNLKNSNDLKTHKNLIALLKNGVVFTKEPGGTEFGEILRELLLEKKFNLSKRAEVLLFLADRSEHYEKVLKMNENKLIISDRSFISGIAYANSSFEFNTLLRLNSFALNSFFPQKVVLLRADERLLKERFAGKNLDNIEARGLEYFLQTQEALISCLQSLKERLSLDYAVFDASQSKQELHEKIKDFIND